MSAHLLLLILALCCFVVNAFVTVVPRVNLTSLGLAFATAAWLVSGAH